LHVGMALGDLVGHAGEGAGEARRVHQHQPLAVAGRQLHVVALPPSGTGRSGISSTFSPLPLSAVRISTSEAMPATSLEGRFTTAATCRPTRSSGSYRSAIRALPVLDPMGPKSMVR